MDQGLTEQEFKRLTYKGKNPDFFTDPQWDFDPGFDPDDDCYAPLVFKNEWNGLPPATKPEPLQNPVRYVRLIPTNTNKVVYPESIQTIQVYQKFYMLYQGLIDMPFNFLMDLNGVAYEGAGWFSDVPKTEEFSHLKGKCLDIGLLGDFRREDPPYKMMRSVMELMKFGIKKKLVNPNFQIIPFREYALRIQPTEDV